MQADYTPGAATDPAPRKDRQESRADRLARFEKSQSELWRLTFFLLFLVSLGLAWLSWPTLRSSQFRLEAAPIGLVILTGLFGVYLWRKSREMAELRGLVRGLDQKDSQLPSDRQMEQLIEIISKS